ncbi:unnamed protein product [Closterium sp. Yama58-4]|nr:unnamed protein product [Closterium sp. Yama58-4]
MLGREALRELRHSGGTAGTISDDCWQADSRDSEGRLVASPVSFPSGIKALADYVHSKGLKLGIYADAGLRTCALKPGSLWHEAVDAATFAEWVGVTRMPSDAQMLSTQAPATVAPDSPPTPTSVRTCALKPGSLWHEAVDAATFAEWHGTSALKPGSLWHETVDAATFAEWGVDYLKYDNCYNDGSPSIKRYTIMRNALEATGRDIFFSMCDWGQDLPALWAYGVADTWRTTRDIEDTWSSMMRIADINNKWAKYAKPGGWNDPDMLQVGNGGMRQSEYRVHFSLWAIMKAPLLIVCDLSAASNETMSILSNNEVIAVNQDSLGVQARKVHISHNSSVEVWSGPLSDDRQVVALVNRGARSENVTVSWKSIGLNAVQRMYARDLWKKSTLDSAFSGEMSARVASHDVRLFVIWPAPDV